MRAGELLHCDVYSSGGERIGHVYEIVAKKTGPVVSELQGRALEVSDLLVGRRASLIRFGYKTREMTGPIGFRFLGKRMSGYRVPWSEVASINASRITLRCAKDELADL